MWRTCDRCKNRFQVEDGETRNPSSLCAACVAIPQWYYVSNRQKVGPVGMTQLQALLNEGQLKTTDMLLPVGATKWVAVESVEE